MNLRIPGPTPLLPQAQLALSQDVIGHRGPEFEALLREVMQQLRHFFQTTSDVLVITASGTGGLEAALVNVLSPGDRVLAVSCGAFGQRFADIARAYGANVVQMDIPWGQAFDAGQVAQALRAHPDVRVLLTTHNETATGVLNDLQPLSEQLRSLGTRRPVWLVDAVSSLGATDLPMDDWGVDIVVSASQKAWMAPPGLAFVGVSPPAWQQVAQARCPRYYWDLITARDYAMRGQTPFTPGLPALYALRTSLAVMAEEGLPAIVARHRHMAGHLRSGLQGLGLRLMAEDAVASPTVTAVYAPAGLAATELQKRLAQEHGVVVATGQGEFKERLLRIAHMGFCTLKDLDGVLAALEAVLHG